MLHFLRLTLFCFWQKGGGWVVREDSGVGLIPPGWKASSMRYRGSVLARLLLLACLCCCADAAVGAAATAAVTVSGTTS